MQDRKEMQEPDNRLDDEQLEEVTGGVKPSELPRQMDIALEHKY